LNPVSKEDFSKSRENDISKAGLGLEDVTRFAYDFFDICLLSSGYSPPSITISPVLITTPGFISGSQVDNEVVKEFEGIKYDAWIKLLRF
jgi:hypothetical protein